MMRRDTGRGTLAFTSRSPTENEGSFPGRRAPGLRWLPRTPVIRKLARMSSDSRSCLITSGACVGGKPARCHSVATPQVDMPTYEQRRGWWSGRPDSNPRHSAWEVARPERRAMSVGGQAKRPQSWCRATRTMLAAPSNGAITHVRQCQ